MASAFQNGVMHACFAALAVLAGVCALVGFRHVGRWLRARLCPVSLVALASAAVIATCEAQKRGNGATRAPLPRSEFTVGSAPPPGAVTNAKWRAHGACEDAFYIRATNWWARMPDGGWIDRLRILSSGGFRARGGGAWTNYPPPFAQKLSLAPEANWPLLEGRDSLFWHAVTPSNTLVMTWRGGLFGRSHTNLVDFQAELFNDGSFDYRYADRTEHFAASLPFDIDGDGLENTIDPDPLTAGPDAHGTNAEWYNTVCSNVFAELSWRGGVNSNAYYFVDVVAKRSTRTTLSVSAYGGNAGGTLHVAAQNIGKLVRTGGNTIPFPYRAVVPPYSSVSLSVEYEAAEHSESTDDISVAASVISLDGSSSAMSSDTVTAIQLRITSCRDFPVFVNRHVYGICEDIWCEWFPQSASINWAYSGGGRWGGIWPSRRRFLFSENACLPIITAANGNVSYNIALRSIEPNSISSEFDNYMVAKPPTTGKAGLVGMLLQLSLMPTNVNFEGLYVEEIPSVLRTHTGYFDKPAFSNWWYHTSLEGAGEWFAVGHGNVFTIDEVSMPSECPPPWTDGAIEWQIPVEWAFSPTNAIGTGTMFYKAFKNLI